MASAAQSPSNEVTVLFEEAALMFALPRGATLEDLAARLATLRNEKFGSPVSIDVRVRS
jgi:hypothetical protein